MTSDERTLIFSLIFGFFLIFAGALKRKIKDDIPLRETYLMLWREGVVGGFKEFRKNFIPVTKKALDAIWGYIKKKFPGIDGRLRTKPEPAKCRLLNDELEYYLQDAVSDYVFKPFQAKIDGAYSPLPSYVYASLYTKRAITEDDEAEIVWALKAKFQDYIQSYGLNFPCFAVPYVQNNHITVYIYYCEFETERQAYERKIDQIMQMRSSSRPINEADTYDRDF